MLKKIHTHTVLHCRYRHTHKHIFIWYYLIYKQIFVTAKRAERSWAAISRNVIFTLYKLDGGFDPLSIYSCNNRSLSIIIVIPHFFPQTISKRFFSATHIFVVVFFCFYILCAWIILLSFCYLKFIFHRREMKHAKWSL